MGKQLCAIRVVTKALYALEEEIAMGISREATLTSRRPEGGRGEDGLPWVAQRWGGAGSSPSVQVVLPPFTISLSALSLMDRVDPLRIVGAFHRLAHSTPLSHKHQ